MKAVDIEAQKQRFIEAIRIESPERAASNALNAAFQRNPTYSAASTSDDRSKFRTEFIEHLLSAVETYRGGVNESNHVDTIVRLSDGLSAGHPMTLAGQRLRIGTTQKALNLFLKTIWCLEPRFATPPHCPVDAIILQAAGIYGSWTKVDSIEAYSEWLSTIRRRASAQGFGSIAEWELETWSSLVLGR